MWRSLAGGAGVVGSCLVLVGGGASGCALDTFDDVADSDAILTVRDVDFPFDAQRSVAVVDEVIDLCEVLGADRCGSLSDEFDQVIVDRVVLNFETAGYEIVDDPQDPEVDLIAIPGRVGIDGWALSGCHPWAGGAPGYWWCYPVGGIPVAYPVGSIAVMLVDPDDVDETDEGRSLVPAVWSGIGAGFLSTATRETTRRIQTAIDQMFIQSPYLALPRTFDE